eukprot:47460-Eustigmatos_ZCMA.PRE.1
MYVHPKNGKAAPLIAEDIYDVIMRNKDRLDAAIINSRDDLLDFFGYRTLERSYLMRIDGK